MRFINAQNLIKASKWEGKPFPFILKYLYGHHHSVVISGLFVFILAPTIATIRMLNKDNTVFEYEKKYKTEFVVVRHDDPNIEEIIRVKEARRDLFPEK